MPSAGLHLAGVLLASVSPLALRYVDVESPAAYSSPEASVLARLFTKLLTDYLNELAYPADLAGVLVTDFLR